MRMERCRAWEMEERSTSLFHTANTTNAVLAHAQILHYVNNPHEVTDRIQHFQEQMAGPPSPARPAASDVNGDSSDSVPLTQGVASPSWRAGSNGDAGSSTLSDTTARGLPDDSGVSSSSNTASAGAVRQRKPHTGAERADVSTEESLQSHTLLSES